MQQEKTHLRIFLISQSDEFESSLFSALRDTKIQLAGNQSDIQMALWEIKTLNPGIVIMDFDNNGVDAIELCKRINNEIDPDIRFIIASDDSSPTKVETAYSAGVSHCIMHPCNMDSLVKKIIVLTARVEMLRRERLLNQRCTACDEHEAGDMLFKIGVPDHCKGYALLKTAIMYVVNDYSLIDNVMTMLYPMLAKRHSSSVSCVERNIRNVIQIIWDRGNMDCLAEIFGATIHSKKGTPSNSQFIATIADIIRCDRKREQPR